MARKPSGGNRSVPELSEPLDHHPPSSIDLLPPETRETIGQLLLRHKRTIDQVVEYLASEGYEISRSAVGRHRKSIKVIGERLRKSREIARAIAETHGDEDEVRTADLNQELLHDLLFRTITAEEDDVPIQYAPKDVMLLSVAASNIAAARKTDAERRRKDREEAEKKERERNAETAKGAAVAAGLSKDTVDAIYHAVLGVAA